MFLRKHISRLVSYIWTQEKSEKIAFEEVLGIFLIVFLYVKIHHRSSEKLLKNSGFLIESTSFFSIKSVFECIPAFWSEKKIEKKNLSKKWMGPHGFTHYFSIAEGKFLRKLLKYNFLYFCKTFTWQIIS